MKNKAVLSILVLGLLISVLLNAISCGNNINDNPNTAGVFGNDSEQLSNSTEQITEVTDTGAVESDTEELTETVSPIIRNPMIDEIKAMPLITEIKTLNDYFVFHYQDKQNKFSVWEQLVKYSQTPGLFISLLEESEDYNVDFDSLSVCSLKRLTNKSDRTSPFGTKREVWDFSSINPYITGLFSFCPIERIVKINDDNVILIFKTADEDGRFVYDYKLYLRTEQKYETGELYELWKEWGENYYVYKLYSMEDLRKLNPGDILSDELLYDLVMVKLQNDWSYYNSYQVEEDYDFYTHPYYTFCICKAVILLRDGVAVIEYKSDNPQGPERKLVGIEFFPYGSKCEKYPLISILADGFVPPLPE